MARPTLEKTRHPGVYRVAKTTNEWLLRAKIKTPTGEEVQKRVRFSGTIEEAVSERAALITGLRTDALSNPVTVPTVIEFVERFVRLRAASWKPSHRDFMATALGSAAEALGTLRVDEVRADHVQKWIGSLRGVDGGIASTSTMRNYLQRFREVMEVARLEGLITINPAHRSLVKAPKGRPPRSPVALSPEECRRLVAALREYDEYLAGLNAIPYLGHATYAFVAIATGLRSGELTSLKWDEHVDLEAGTLRVVANHWKGVSGTRKTGRRDTLYLSEELVDALREHRAASLAGCSEAQLASGLVFPSTNGKLASGRVRKALDWACERAGLPRMVAHDLRHTATTLWNQVASRRVAQLAIGHVSARAHDGYHHPYDDEFRRAGDAVGALLRAEVSTSGVHPSGNERPKFVLESENPSKDNHLN